MAMMLGYCERLKSILAIMLLLMGALFLSQKDFVSKEWLQQGGVADIFFSHQDANLRKKEQQTSSDGWTKLSRNNITKTKLSQNHKNKTRTWKSTYSMNKGVSSSSSRPAIGTTQTSSPTASPSFSPTTRTTKPPSWHLDRSIAIVVQLSGEMGNNLGKIAFAKYLQLRLQDDYQLSNTHLVFKHQDNRKWERTKNQVKWCFPKLRLFDFTLGNTPEFENRSQAQIAWLGEEESKRLKVQASQTMQRENDIRQSLDFFVNLLLNNQGTDKTSIGPPPPVPDDANITIPYLHADTFAGFPEVDRYYDEIRDLFEFDDDSKCCKELPAPDESTFHFRNFQAEMRRADKMGFTELNYNLTASELFGHLEPGSKVAITTRFNNEAAQKYVKALEDRGLHARLVTGQKGPQDFCFLRKTQQELAGSRISTFFFWAAFLANNTNTTHPSKVWFYSINSTDNSHSHFKDYDFHNRPHNWTYHKELDEWIKFVDYQQSPPTASIPTLPTTSSPTTSLPTSSPTTSTTKSPPWNVDRSIAIVVQLAGEMGNNLGKIAFAKYLQLRLRDDYQVSNTHLVFKHQDHRKWFRTMKQVKSCFPKLRLFDFTLGNTPEFDDRSQAQMEWLGEEQSKRLKVQASKNMQHENSIRQSLDFFVNLLLNNQGTNKTSIGPPPPIPDDANITIPYLHADTFAGFPEVDRYYDEIRDLLEFDDDNSECCKELPAPDESTFHFRNFQSEMMRAAKLGFTELNYNLTASELFGHLEPGSKVAITTRINNEAAQKYVKALEDRGLHARLVTGQNGPQDFCFLRKTQQELAGSRISTFFFWAAFLANNTNTRHPSKVWFYSVNTTYSRYGHFKDYDFHNRPHNWTYHKELDEWIKFVDYQQ